MAMKKCPEAVYHVYQRSRGGGLVFYSQRDYLVFFTGFCALARRCGQHILALCPMPDHIHHIQVAGEGMSLTQFVGQYTQHFSTLWNRSRGRNGSLFEPLGQALKRGGKPIRTTLAYNYNNPVERQLIEKADKYRWNFLPYASSGHPFSPPILSRCLSRPFKRVLAEAEACFAQEKGVNYAQLQRWQNCLSPLEQQQLTDHVIDLWNVIDYETAWSYYGSLDTMVRAFRDNTGSEYDLQEEWDPYSDAVYADCTRVLLKECSLKDVYEIPSLSADRKSQLFSLLQQRTTARPRQIAKYLWHLNA